VSLTDDGEQFEVVVTDAVPGAELAGAAGTTAADGHGAAEAGLPAGFAGFGTNLAVIDDEVPLRLPDGVGLAVIAGLADDVRIAAADPGTSVTMSWKRRAG
jgi:hypothetical protein